jgi:hypothetical protein
MTPAGNQTVTGKENGTTAGMINSRVGMDTGKKCGCGSETNPAGTGNGLL